MVRCAVPALLRHPFPRGRCKKYIASPRTFGSTASAAPRLLNDVVGGVDAGQLDRLTEVTDDPACAGGVGSRGMWRRCAGESRSKSLGAVCLRTAIRTAKRCMVAFRSAATKFFAMSRPLLSTRSVMNALAAPECEPKAVVHRSVRQNARSDARFVLARGSDFRRSRDGRLEASAAREPQTAEAFARLAASGRSGEGAATVHLFDRADRPGVIELTGNVMSHEMAARFRMH